MTKTQNEWTEITRNTIFDVRASYDVYQTFLYHQIVSIFNLQLNLFYIIDVTSTMTYPGSSWQDELSSNFYMNRTKCIKSNFLLKISHLLYEPRNGPFQMAQKVCDRGGIHDLRSLTWYAAYRMHADIEITHSLGPIWNFFAHLRSRDSLWSQNGQYIFSSLKGPFWGLRANHVTWPIWDRLSLSHLF